MKAATIIYLAIGVFIFPFLLSSLTLQPYQAQAQESGYLEPYEKYSQEELAQMLAPIALYPDALLSQLLMASTYPIEVIEADRWVRRNSELKDEALDNALLDQDWDPSVKAVCHFPAVLAVMSDKITQTTSIGNAFLAQEDEVMDMVQELRAKAKAQGNLSTNTEQKVIIEKETIIIQPANPRVVYVPYYDPSYIYGSWWYPAYPPYYWGPPGVNIGISYWPGFYFGFAWGTWSYFDWHQRNIYIDARYRPRYVRHDRWRTTPGHWNHAPVHRRGVAYRDKPTARRYGQYPSRNREYRPDTRGFPERSNQDRGRILRSGDRTRIDRDRSVDVRTRIDDRDRQELQRVERDRQIQQRTRIEPTRQERQRDKGDRQMQQPAKIEPARQEAQRVERDRQIQQRTRIKPDTQQRQRVEPAPQMQQRAVQERQTRQRAELQQQQRSRNNVFNRVEDGRSERRSSERGRSSRQGLGAESSGRGRSGNDNRGGRSQRP